MRNFKKVIAVVVTFVMLLSVAGIAASAEGEAVINLYGKSQTNPTDTGSYYELKVVLDKNSNTVGGVEGLITYNPDVFELAADKTVLTDAFVAAGNSDYTSVINETIKGQIKFVALTGNMSGEMFTLKFTVAEVKEAKNAEFAITGLQGATTEKYVTVTYSPKSAAVTNEALFKVEGATIKYTDSVDQQDIKFKVNVDTNTLKAMTTDAGKKVTEYGVLMMFTRGLGYEELVVDMNPDPEKTGGLVVAKRVLGEGETVNFNDGYFWANLNGVPANILGIRISARAYITISDGNESTTYYSKNFYAANDVKSGYASKSVIDVARKAALEAIEDNSSIDPDGTYKTRLESQGISSPEDRSALFAFVKQHCQSDSES